MNRATKKGIMRILTLLCLAVFLFSAWKLVGIFQEYREAEQLYNDAANEFTSNIESK